MASAEARVLFLRPFSGAPTAPLGTQGACALRQSPRLLPSACLHTRLPAWAHVPLQHPCPGPCRMAPEHEAAVAREIRRLEGSQGFPLRGIWEDSPAAAEGAGASRRGGGAIVIK